MITYKILSINNFLYSTLVFLLVKTAKIHLLEVHKTISLLLSCSNLKRTDDSSIFIEHDRENYLLGLGFLQAREAAIVSEGKMNARDIIMHNVRMNTMVQQMFMKRHTKILRIKIRGLIEELLQKKKPVNVFISTLTGF